MIMADEEKKPEANGVAPEWPKILKLRKPVIANGDEVMELSFREPTPADIERCGDPVRIDFFTGAEAKLIYNDVAVSAMMSTLAAVPPSTIKQMALKDWKNGRLLLTIPFLED